MVLHVSLFCLSSLALSVTSHPTRRQMPGLPGMGGGGDSGGLPGLPPLPTPPSLPGMGGGDSGGIPGLPPLPGMGGDDGGSGGFPGLPPLPGMGGDDGGSGGFPGLPSLPGMGGGTKKRQLPGLPPLPGMGGDGNSGGLPGLPPLPGSGGDGNSGGLPGLPPLPGSGGDDGGSGGFPGLPGLPGMGGSGGDTRDDVKNGECKDVTVIFARGTTEQGNVGSIVGPPFFSALEKDLDSVAVQGVDYPADIPGYLSGGDKEGGKTMADLATQAASKCPDTQIVLSGYSQGGQLTHFAASQLDDATLEKISAVVIFGDPLNPKPVDGVDQSKVKVFCAEGDSICEGQPMISPAHLGYGDDAGKAAEFVEQHVNNA